MAFPFTVGFLYFLVVSVRLVLQQGGVNVDVPENGGPASICTEVASGILADGQSATVTLSTSDGGAERKRNELVTLPQCVKKTDTVL